jgi:NAD dependent epimerase/dehydratase
VTRAFVTGAGGFIASHLIERLITDGTEVRALVRYTSRRDVGNLNDFSPGMRDALDIRFGSLLDGDFVRQCIEGCDVVLHLGASISVPYSYVAPREVVQANVDGTLNVLSGAMAAGTPRVVQLSSSEVYGTAQYVPIDEAHPLHPQSPYAASKVGADKLAEAFHLSFGLPVVIARPFNTYGPRQSLRAVIPTVISQALAGDELELGSMTPTRDFVYVADTVDGLVRLARLDGEEGETFNIATGTDVSVGGVVELVSDLVGRPLHVRTQDERVRPENSEVHRLIGANDKLRSATGWSPSTPLRDGLQRVIDWMSERAAKPGEYVI